MQPDNLLHIIAQKDGFTAQLKPAAIFKNALLLAADYSLGSPLSIIKQGSNALVQLLPSSTRDSKAHRTFKLVGEALLTTCLLNIYRKPDLQQLDLLKKNINIPLKELTIRVDKTFFEDATQLTALQEFKAVYLNWLRETLDLPKHRVKDLEESFGRHFLDALALTWAENSTYYQPVYNYFHGPFEEQRVQAARKRAYKAQLKDGMRTLALGDRLLPLESIYVKPDYQVLARAEHGQAVFSEERSEDLHTFVHQQIVHPHPSLKNERKRLFILLGQPGQGKTSFCHKLVYDLLDDRNFNQPLYLVKLREIEAVKKLLEEPFSTLKTYLEEEHQLEVSFDKNKPITLVLDGLDELYMSEGLTNSNLQTLYSNLNRRKNWTIVLTSRHHYLAVQHLTLSGTMVLKLAPLSLTQQLDWLKRYKERYPEASLDEAKLQNINEERKFKHVKELIEQPILLHIVTLANIALDQNDSRASLYRTLFDKLLARNTTPGKEEKYRHLAHHPDLFRAWLREIAFTVYQNEHEYLTYVQLQALETTGQVKSIVNTSENIKEALKDLLIAFYFKKSKTAKQGGAIEFLHKSLGEYLTAEYFLKQLQAQLLPDAQGQVACSTPLSILELCSGWFATHGLSPNLRNLLVELIGEMDDSLKTALRNALKAALDDCLDHQFLWSYAAANNKTRPPVQQMAHTFHGYWWILAYLHPEQNGELIHEGNRFAFLVLIRLPYSHAPLFLSYLNLRGADLSRAYLNGANLREANLIGAYLIGVNLIGVNLIGVNLNGAYLNGANLNGANLNGANLREANLREANLSGADLREANLSRADLSRADLSRAKVSNLTFFQDLLNEEYTGVESLMEKYAVNPTPQHHSWDENKKRPYYLIELK